MFRRVAKWVASPEPEDKRSHYENTFFNLMTSKRFCPGGRVLAGAATSHGNVLNCFCQDGAPEPEGTDSWVLRLATKLALVTRVGGGNGLCLDPIRPKRPYNGPVGKVYLTIDPAHPDYEKVKSGTYMDLVHGKYVSKDYKFIEFVEMDKEVGSNYDYVVPDDTESIWYYAGKTAQAVLAGDHVLIDLSKLRAEGQPVRGSGGTSSGPSSFAVEIFDNFAYWGSLGGAEYAGPVTTLRYVFSPTLRAIRQGGVRRGAGMATISATHEDAEDFIDSKDLEREAAEGSIDTFNISVLVSDKLMSSGAPILRKIARHAWKTGEPGLIFLDRVNDNNAAKELLGLIKSTNPCG